jgi:hypothetical protein
VQEDNVAAEFNIPPADGAEVFNRNIALVLTYLKKVAKKHGCELCFSPALDFPIEQVSTPHARLMGCDPDYSVWTMAVNPRPIAPERMRTAAGHVHISWTGPVTMETQTLVGRGCDVFLGMPHIIATEKSRRRELYGKAGCIRPKDWGIEYRTLDCSWIQDYRMRKAVFRNIEALFFRMQEDNKFPKEVDSWGDEIQHAINNHDKDLALTIADTFDVKLFPYI